MTQYADPLDAAADRAEQLLEAALAHRQPEGPAATGRCLDPYCDEEISEPGRRFCDADCRDAYEKWRRLNPGTQLNKGV